MTPLEKLDWQVEVDRLLHSGEWVDIDPVTQRMRTPTGWLIRHTSWDWNTLTSTYVPDPDGEWYLEKKEKD